LPIFFTTAADLLQVTIAFVLKIFLSLTERNHCLRIEDFL